MAATNTTAKQVQSEIVRLKRDRFVTWHLLHPENDMVDETRSMHPLKCHYLGTLYEICRRCDNFFRFPPREPV
jgi:hypothetical protein